MRLPRSLRLPRPLSLAVQSLAAYLSALSDISTLARSAYRHSRSAPLDSCTPPLLDSARPPPPPPPELPSPYPRVYAGRKVQAAAAIRRRPPPVWSAHAACARHSMGPAAPLMRHPLWVGARHVTRHTSHVTHVTATPRASSATSRATASSLLRAAAASSRRPRAARPSCPSRRRR